MDLTGAAALVTGGGSGIGAATVHRLEAAGARVAVLDRQPGGDAPGELPISCDVADEEQVASAVRQVVETFDGLDVAVLAAGVGGMNPVRAMDAAEWDRIVGVNLRGLMLCLRECANGMVQTGRRGTIVAVGSVSGILADRGLAHYAVSKAGVHELVRVAARELGPNGIRVNAVAPGATDTPMFSATDRNPGYRERIVARTALGRIGTADEVAAAIVALATLDWVTGQILLADGGLSLWSPIDPMERS